MLPHEIERVNEPAWLKLIDYACWVMLIASVIVYTVLYYAD